MTHRPSVVVFDVNETLSDLSPLTGRFEELGLAGGLAATWFAGILRDGFALAVAGGAEDFSVIGEQVLRQLISGQALRVDADSAVRQVMSAFTELGTHPDVAPGVRALRATGLRLVTLSNGSVAVGEGLLARAGLLGEFERLMSVQDAGVWKPAAASYLYAARECGVDPDQMVLVAVHPWDIHGAARAGLATAWVNRGGSAYPAHFDRPTWEVDRLDALASVLPPGR